MSAAFLVKYRGPSGDCPNAVVSFNSTSGKCVAGVASRVKELLVRARGGAWQDHEVTLREVTYLGPAFLAEHIDIV